MLEKPDYLKIGKPTALCASCGIALAESERLASVLLPAESPAPPYPESQENQLDDFSPAEPSAERKKTKSSEARTTDDTAHADEEENAFQRKDYCPDCWKELKDQAYFSYWIAKRSPSKLPPRKLNKAERNVALAALFDSLSEQNQDEADYAPHLFFLAHLLMKFKVFRWMPSVAHPETGEAMLRFAKTQINEEVLVRDLEMPDAMVVQIKEEVESYVRETTGQIITL